MSDNKQITQEDFERIQNAINKKQKFMNKAINFLQNGDYETSKTFFDIEISETLEIINLVSKYFEKKSNIKPIEEDETMYEEPKNNYDEIGE